MKILVCVGASVALYKMLDLTRLLSKEGHFVRVILSPNASKMLPPTLFEALGMEVFIKDTPKMEHIYLTRWCDILLLCPGTASTIGKISNGIGGNLLLDSFLAKPQTLKTVIVPAMNVEMWNNPFVQKNLHILKNNGFYVMEPQSGLLACGEVGMGKLPPIEEIAQTLYNVHHQNVQENIKNLQNALPQQKMRVLITAGGTIERIDDVRYLTNFSSGKQALEIVNALNDYDVTVIVAKVEVEFPSWCKIIKVESANQMLTQVLNKIHSCDVFIGCAAVADFTFQKQDGKIKKGEISELKLIHNPDILQTVGNLPNKPKCVVGFAVESENILKNAIEKLQRKNCDLLIANGLVFGKEETSGFIISKNETSEEFSCSKQTLAWKIKNAIEKLFV